MKEKEDLLITDDMIRTWKTKTYVHEILEIIRI